MHNITTIISWLLTAVTVAIGIAFSALNNQEVVLHTYWHSISLSIGILVPLAMLAGALLAFLTMIPLLIRYYATVRSLRAALQRAEHSIAHNKVVAITE